MYCYSIGKIGFCFDSEEKLVEQKPYDIFRVSSEEYFKMSERQHYSFFKNEAVLPKNKSLIFSSSSCDVFETKDEYIHINKRFDKGEYQCILVSPKNQSGGCFYYTNSGSKKIKTTAEFFRCVDFISALLFYNAVILHSSYIIYEDKAILFSADSNGGKSTQAQLWKETYGAEIINGDRAIIKKESGGWFVHSLPMCGSSGICKQKSARLKTIVMLEKGSENRAQQLTKRQKLELLLSQLTFESSKNDDFQRFLSLVQQLIDECEIIHLVCTPEKQAAEVLKDYIF